jgi:predicted nucleic acid-binding protein
MATILVDSSVLLDLMTRDSEWFEWSRDTLRFYASSNIIAINQVIYAEVSPRFERIEEVESALPEALFERRPIPWEAAFVAGKCFVQYRKRGGIRSSPLPDFFIGAHAAVEGLPLLTRDAARFRTYFPRLKIIAPE